MNKTEDNGKIILAIDCGTQSLRGLLFDKTGNLLEKARIEYAPYIVDKPNWAEQDPEVWWNSLCLACRQLKNQNPHLFDKIAGVGITTQRTSMINIDNRGMPLRNAITWLDDRKAKPFYYPRGILKGIFKLIGLYEPLLKIQSRSAGNWIRQNQPDIWQQTAKFIQVSCFLNGRLTGNYADSRASQVGYIPFDYKKGQWITSLNDLVTKLFPVEKEKLCDLVDPGDLIGKITEAAAKQTCLVPGLPVIACGSDKGCETLGMGVMDDNTASLSFGTMATIQTTCKHYFQTLPIRPSYPALIPGWYNPEIQIIRGYWMINWFKNELGYKEVLEAEKEGIAPEVVLNKFLKEVPAGSMGLIIQPYWSPGLMDPAAKGTIIGFGDVHKKGHLYKAVVEGIAYALRDGMRQVEKAGGLKFHKAMVSGGASQSDEVCQITADIFNLPMVRGKTIETSGLGAAIAAAVGIGLYPDFKQAIQNMVQYERTFNPDPANVPLYDKLYHRVYRKIYKTVFQLSKEIRDITGYPEKIY